MASPFLNILELAQAAWKFPRHNMREGIPEILILCLSDLLAAAGLNIQAYGKLNAHLKCIYIERDIYTFAYNLVKVDAEYVIAPQWHLS